MATAESTVSAKPNLNGGSQQITTMLDQARHEWLVSNRHLLISNERQDASIFRAGHVIDEAQIVALYREQRYEDEADIPRSDARPMLRLRR